jgi:hypothetical protein
VPLFLNRKPESKLFVIVGVKVKVIPQQASIGPRSSGSVKAPGFLDVRHYKGGRSSAIRTARLYPRRNRKKKSATPPGIDPGTVRLVAQCLNHYATPGPSSAGTLLKYVYFRGKVH